MSDPKTPVWLELVQLVPIVTLALPFIAAGGVDLSRAKSGLLAGALLTIPVTGLVVWKRGVISPILLGTALWLWVGAASFALALPALRAAVLEAQGFGLFTLVFAAGIVTTFGSAQGFIGCRHRDPEFIRRASLGLLGLAAVALGWSWFFRHDIRVGGGLPFIVLNVTRRVIVARAART